MFSAPIAIESGVVVERDGFVFADVMKQGLEARGWGLAKAEE